MASFKRKLVALEHPNPDSFNIESDQSVRQLVVWLEDHKVRHYKIEQRTGLKEVQDGSWPANFGRYLTDLKCPFTSKQMGSVIDWLLALAIQLEYSDNASMYSAQTASHVRSLRTAAPEVVNTNPLDSLDFSCTEFKDGVQSLAEVLNVPKHPDHLVTLAAVSHLVTTRLSQTALATPGEHIHEGKAYPIFSADLGFDTGDQRLNNAGKVLRLLYIQDMRRLQTSVNECIVAAQNVTANPKTDARLGKVGR